MSVVTLDSWLRFTSLYGQAVLKMEQWVLGLTLVTAALALGTFIVNVVDTVGDSASHKRSILLRVVTQSLFGASLFILGGVLVWHYHPGNSDDKKDGISQAQHAKPRDPDIGAPDNAEKVAELTPPTVQTTDEHDKVTATNREPTLSHINKAVLDAPPFRRRETADQFVGALVSWDVGFWSALGTDKGLARIAVEPFGHLSGMATLAIDIDNHKYLLDAPRGAALHVDAVIDSVSEDGIVTLRDAKLRPATPPDE